MIWVHLRRVLNQEAFPISFKICLSKILIVEVEQVAFAPVTSYTVKLKNVIVWLRKRSKERRKKNKEKGMQRHNGKQT